MREENGKRLWRGTNLLDFGYQLGDTIMRSGGNTAGGRRREEGIPRRGNTRAFRFVLTEHENRGAVSLVVYSQSSNGR